MTVEPHLHLQPPAHVFERLHVEFGHERLAAIVSVREIPVPAAAAVQGLTLAHFKAKRERFVWYKGCA